MREKTKENPAEEKNKPRKGRKLAAPLMGLAQPIPPCAERQIAPALGGE
jgi:hypothetical protein